MDNDFVLWLFIAIICAVAMFAQGASIIRMLFRERLARRWYLLPAIPFAISIWAFGIGWYAVSLYQNYDYSWSGVIMGRFTMALWLHVQQMVDQTIDQAIPLSQVLLGATIVVFLALHLLLGKRRTREQSPTPLALQIAMLRR